MNLNDSQLLRRQAWINGQWCDARSGDTITVTNPADGHALGRVPTISRLEVRSAIDAADKAMVDWRRRPAKERSRILNR
jgi:succinate-semialdehyde dehydrogenase / glutarate-semialdehyde dehydrogenase